jgi:eukaryotic-like serine/threonine-protein kinase
MRFAPGMHLGPYEILAPLGAGGMGEVYRARDGRLGRDVAVKVLPAAFSSDADRLRRFEQEARATGMLNHPNILAVYDFGADDGAPYLVAELLEGMSLRECLSGGAMPPRRAVDYAVQTGYGLAAAHAKGVVHRDLKPDNLFITTDGRIKILDFGLAKLAPRESAGHSQALTATIGTIPGVVLGTVGYMSPEQVRGQEVDHRSDLFALGAILYQMLTGVRAFTGNSSVEVLNAILKEDPPEPSQMSATVPPALDRIVGRCLEKDPARRFQSAADLTFALETLATSPREMSRPRTGVRPVRRWLPATAAVVLGAAIYGSFWLGRRSVPTSQPEYHQLTFQRGSIQSARLAPDGQVVYAAAWDGKPMEMFSTRADNFESRSLGVANAEVLSISSSGEMAILLNSHFPAPFIRTGTLARVPLGGGTPREVLDDVMEADWTPDGKNLVVVHRVAGRNRVEFPIGNTVYETPDSINGARLSPDGARIAFVERHPGGDVIGLFVWEGGKPRLLAPLPGTTFWGLSWSASGEEVWYTAAEGSVRASLSAVTLSGRQRLVARIPGTLALRDIASNGRVLMIRQDLRNFVTGIPPGETHERDLSWLDAGSLSDVSADGKAILVAVPGGRDHSIFYLRKTDGSATVRLGESPLWAAALSPDRKWILVESQTAARLTMLPTGTGAAKAIPIETISRYSAMRYFPDGNHIAFTGNEPGHGPRLYVATLAGGKPQALAPEGEAADGTFSISPDGQLVAALNVNRELSFYPAAGGQPLVVRGAARGDLPIRWSEDGRAIYVYQPRELGARVEKLDLSTGHKELLREIAVADPAGVFSYGLSHLFLTPDGKGYFYGYGRMLSELYLVDSLR